MTIKIITDKNGNIINVPKPLGQAMDDFLRAEHDIIEVAREAGDIIEAIICHAGLIGEEFPESYVVILAEHTCPKCHKTIRVSALTRADDEDVAYNSTGEAPASQNCGDADCCREIGWPRTTREQA